MERLLRARVRRVDRPHALHHVVVTVDLVNKDHARLGVAVRGGHDAIPNVRRIDHAGARRLFLRARVEQARRLRLVERRAVAERHRPSILQAVDGVRAVLHGVEDGLFPRLVVEGELIPLLIIHGGEELVRHRHGDVEVGQGVLVVLGVDEAEQVRVVNPHDAHVRAAPDAALLHRVGRRVKDVHERDRARSDAVRRAHHRARGPQLLEREARAAARLVDDGRVGRRLHDARDGVRHVEDEARGELARRLARVDEAGRVRDELAPQHDAAHHRIELLAPGRVHLGVADVPDDAAHDVGPLLDGLPLRVLQAVALRDHAAGVKAQDV